MEFVKQRYELSILHEQPLIAIHVGEKFAHRYAVRVELDEAARDPRGVLDHGRHCRAAEQPVEIDMPDVDIGMEPWRSVAREGRVVEVEIDVALRRVEAERLHPKRPILQLKAER